MSLTALTVFAVALLAGAGSPGPSVAALVSRVLTNGFRDVLPFLAALWLGEAVWLTLAAAGLAALAQTFGTAFVVIRYAGAAYLLVLAWRMWTAPVDAGSAALPVRRPWRMFLAGLSVSLGNPKNAAFYLALLPTIVDLDRIGAAGWAELVATMLVVLAAVDLTWSLAAVRARRLLRSPRAMRTANRVGATMIAGAAGAIAIR